MPATSISNARIAPLTGFASSIPGRILISLGATALLAASAHVAVPLWFTPVPFIMTPLVVLAIGMFLGPVQGFLTLVAYLAEGAMGLPVFSPTSPVHGVAQLLGPTGGYLMSYPLVAAVAGGVTRALQTRTKSFPAGVIACTLASIPLFVLGAGWFQVLTHLPFSVTLAKTVVPFLPGEAVKVLAAAGIYSALTRNRA